MKILFHDKLYSKDISKRKLLSIQKKVKKSSVKMNLYFITLPVYKYGLLELYWYPELLQTYYKEVPGELIVVGMAYSREAAYEVILQIISEVGVREDCIPVSTFFEENR